MTGGALPFLILTLPRSGSYHLCALLDSAPDLVCHGEVYKKERVELAAPLRAALGLGLRDVAARDAMGAGFPARLAALAPGRAVGFKAFPGQLARLAHRRALLFGPGRRRILLRRDPVESFLSRERVRIHGRWVRLAGEPPSPAPPLRWRREAFEAHLARARRFDDLCARVERAAPELALRLDHAALGDAAALEGVLSFLGSGAAPGDLRSDRVRQHEGGLCDGVENVSEMAAHLAALGLDRPLAHCASG